MRRSSRPSAARSAQLAARAAHMRHAPSWPEAVLWRELCGGRLGVRFQRQVPLGGRYIADFLAPAARLVVEVDGAQHARRAAADARRDRVLGRLGYRVLRLDAQLVLRDLPAAVALVREALSAG